MMTTKKKRFGTLSVVGEGISSVLRNADNSIDGLNVEQVPLARIDPDPENPRRLGIDRDSLRLYSGGYPVPQHLRTVWDALQELAESIRQIGVQQAIKCYRHGDRFRIAFGERRFYASILAGRENIPAWILDEKPYLLRRIQYSENVLRENLTPWERVSNVMALIDEYKTVDDKELSSRGLAEILGVSHTQANAYLSIIRGPSEVREWLKSNEISTIDAAATLARVDNSEKRRKVLNAPKHGIGPKKAIELPQEQPRGGDTIEMSVPKATADSMRGRPRTHINLGRTENTEVVRKIIATVAGDGFFPDTDWKDFRAVSRVWNQFVQSLEKGDF